ncbi:conserved hypothetical protein [Xanthomonas citri pv. aurantifolii str. ICPB 11122]|nr:conserved hypothetical protein [Xanthomonas citri pv. aurantifolii str. ICPB 11122]
MTVVPDAPVTPAALSAFLRGVERRGLVLAQLQCGDVAAAERALAAALRAFSSQAAGRPMAGWPMRFWSLLATAPPLRREPMPGTWLPPFTALGRMQTADRLALLLRIVAGLEEGVASEVQGVETADYRQLLARACPRDAAGNPDAQAWRALAEAAQVELRDLSPAQLTRLGQLRDSALAGMPLHAAEPGEADHWIPGRHGSCVAPLRSLQGVAGFPCPAHPTAHALRGTRCRTWSRCPLLDCYWPSGVPRSPDRPSCNSLRCHRQST